MDEVSNVGEWQAWLEAEPAAGGAEKPGRDLVMARLRADEDVGDEALPAAVDPVGAIGFQSDLDREELVLGHVRNVATFRGIPGSRERAPPAITNADQPVHHRDAHGC
jgi:hypothetical protein